MDELNCILERSDAKRTAHTTNKSYLVAHVEEFIEVYASIRVPGVRSSCFS